MGRQNVHATGRRRTKDAWKPSQLEYAFALATPAAGQNVLLANEYTRDMSIGTHSISTTGSPHWLRTSRPGQPGADAGTLTSFIPAPISFKGMPHPRFWQMEENQTDFGAIGASTTALLHLVFAEFGLIYSNDWFMLPFPMPFNSLCEIRGIAVTRRLWHRDADPPGGRRRPRPIGIAGRCSTTRTGAIPAATRIASTSRRRSPTTSRASPVEKINFLRDEAANMVWAVENIVPSLAGVGIRGDEMDIGAPEPPPFVPAGTAPIRYVAGTTVPTNWIPFLPVHLPGSVSEIRLQRARMPAARRSARPNPHRSASALIS